MSTAIRCDVCGRFLSFKDLREGTATVRLLTPDSHFSREEYERFCPEHHEPNTTAPPPDKE